MFCIKFQVLFVSTFTCFFYVNAQDVRTDSITNLINNTSIPAEKSKLLLERSKVWQATQMDKSLADVQQSLAICQQSKNEEGSVDAYLQLSGIYSRQSKFKLALDFDSVAYQIANKVGYKKGMALTMGSIGRNNMQLGNNQLAETASLTALQLLKDNGLESETPILHNILGTIYRRLGKMPQSLSHFDEGIAIGKKYLKNQVLSVLLMNKANTLTESAKYDEAIDLHLQSIRLKETLKDERGLMQSYNNIAIPYMRAEEYAISLEYYRKGIALAKKFNNKSSIGFNYSNTANIFIKLKQLDSVPFCYNEAIAAFKETGEKNGLALAYHNYGNFLLEQKIYAQAEPLLNQALVIRKQTQSPYDIASTMNVLGALMTATGRPEAAEQLLLQSLAMLKGENGERQKSAYVYLAAHYKSIGDYEEAYRYQANYLTMKDTLVTEGEVTKMLRAQSGYEVEKREAQLALEKKENELQSLLVKQKNGQLFYTLIALGLALMLALAYYLIYRNKKQHASVLENKNAQIETLIKELHHRVKNNLQVVSSLLSLQSNRIQDATAKEAMQAGRTRVDAMAMIHQKLYMDKDLAAVDIKEYLQQLSASLAGSFGYSAATVSTDVQMAEATVDIDKAIPIGLIVNELITNAFKHAFTGIDKPLVSIKLSQVNNEMQLQISDNGTGFIADHHKPSAFGMKLVNTLLSQIDATMETHTIPNTLFLIKIKN